MPSLKVKKVSFTKYLKKFPPVELPVTLSNDTHLAFSSNNPPLDPLEIEDYILPLEKNIDEFTEFIPCFCLPDTDEFIGIVYFKASLMDYQYRMVTYDKRGEMVGNEVIAGVFSNGDMIAQSVATIDPTWTIHIVSGQGKADAARYDPSESTSKELEIFKDGVIGVLG
ncbi:MAG: hypothetical protein AAF960_22650 [Bacteroidota bacterium]